MGDKIRIHLFISGRVQGVFYRQNAKNKAEKLKINGWVKNLEDGRIEAVFEGEKEKVEEMVEWAKRGPIIARVDNIEIIKEEYQDEFRNFEIRN